MCLFSTLLAGTIVVNVNPLYTVPELTHQLCDSGVQTIVVLENFTRTLEQAPPSNQVRSIVITDTGNLTGGALNLEDRALNFVMHHVQKQVPPCKLPSPVWLRDVLAVSDSRTMQSVQLALEDIVFLQYTGGTTGMAKGVMLTHRNVIANLLQTGEQSKSMFSDGVETNVTLLPLYHIFSFTVDLLMLVTLGGRNILIANPRNTERVIFILRNKRFPGIMGVNTLFNILLGDPDFATRNFSAMKIAIGDDMTAQRAIAQRQKEVTSHAIIEGYGLTECSPVVSMNPPHMTELSGTIGLPASSTKVRFKRDDGTIAPLGEPGELQVRGLRVVRGYWQCPEETAKSIDAEGQFSIDDIGVVDANGCIHLIDRKKDIILISGFDVHPNEIEGVVALHPDVPEVAAIGVSDPVVGKRVKIIVVPRTGALTEPTLLEHCRAHLTGYKMPRIIGFRHEELPKSTMGKVLRRELHDTDPDIERTRAQAQQ